MKPPRSTFQLDAPRYQRVQLHRDAHVHREDLSDLVGAIAALPGQSSRLKAALGKWNGTFARLALTFHLIECAAMELEKKPTPILTILSAETAAKAAAFLKGVLLPHLHRADALMFSTQQTSHARWIAGFILAKPTERIATREIVQAYGPLRAPEARRELLEVIESLVAIGWLRPEEHSNPARPTTAWSVNPKVYTLFAGRAAEERQRRESGRERLAEAVARGRTTKGT